MNKVELSLSKYEEMRDKIEELEEIVKAHDESGKYVVKNIVEQTETVGTVGTSGQITQRVLHTHYTIHGEAELKTLIAGSEVMKMKSQIASYERVHKNLHHQIDRLEIENRKLRAKKWYQFWK